MRNGVKLLFTYIYSAAWSCRELNPKWRGFIITEWSTCVVMVASLRDRVHDTLMTRDALVMTHVTIDIWSRPVIRNWGPPGQCWANNYNPVLDQIMAEQTLGPQLCCVRGLKHQDTHKGSPLFKIKAPCASEDLFWLDWVLASEQSRHGWQWSCSHKRQFSPQARFWFFRRLNPVSNVRWEEGRKETTTLLLISRGFSTWDFEA